MCGQPPDPAYPTLEKAYAALRASDYAEAVTQFLRAIDAAPARPAIRKDLAYTYLKIGENEAARDQFAEALRLDPNDSHLALEYAFLCYETGERAMARRIFDRVRKVSDPTLRATAEEAFQNVDRPLAEAIARWSEALRCNPNDFSSHLELARLAEERDELELAAEHYRRAWALKPTDRSLLVGLGRVWKAAGKIEPGHAALLAASRGAEPHAAERAKALLPRRYPYVYEFRQALELDPTNVELRRELAYLLLKMERRAEAEYEFQVLTELAPEDLLSAAQLGFLRLSRNDSAGAMPLLERVLKGSDEELADRVRSALGLPQALRRRPEVPRRSVSLQARELGERSYEAGYLKDALKYLEIAHEIDPADFAVMLKLGWTYNVLGQDRRALHWFDMARKSPEPAIAAEADKAYRNLRPELAPARLTGWLLPFYSSRWRDLFSYGQIKTELKLGRLPFRPYFSTRFIGDTRRTTGGARPQYLSESSLIFGLGVATSPWRRFVFWAEAGQAVNYLGRRPDMGRAMPDYRGGVAYARGFGSQLGGESRGLFFETGADGVFVSRFGNDFLICSQQRFGYTATPAQFYWNVNATVDVKREYWANTAEFGPGVRLRLPWLPKPLAFSLDFLRGGYMRNRDNPRPPNYWDMRTGFWYAFTR